jgi:translation initiation factor 1A
MGKNMKGGKKGKKGKSRDTTKKELTFKEDGQEYAQVVRMLGNGRLEALCYDGKSRLGIIRGKMRKKVWINIGDIVLVGLRDFQDDKCDIMHKYTADESRQLKAYGELPKEAKINEDEKFDDDGEDCPFEFGDPVDSDEEDVKKEVEVDLDDI